MNRSCTLGASSGWEFTKITGTLKPGIPRRVIYRYIRTYHGLESNHTLLVFRSCHLKSHCTSQFRKIKCMYFNHIYGSTHPLDFSRIFLCPVIIDRIVCIVDFIFTKNTFVAFEEEHAIGRFETLSRVVNLRIYGNSCPIRECDCSSLGTSEEKNH